MRFDIRAPGEIIALAAADLKKRRARIDKEKSMSETSRLEGLVPLATVLGYHRVLKRMSEGRAQVVFCPDHYAVVEDPPDLLQPVAVRV